MANISASTHLLTLQYYNLKDLRSLLEKNVTLKLDPEVEDRIERGARFVKDKAAEDRYIYGVNTGFGSLCETRVKAEEMEQLQYNHIVSHACGIGEIVPEAISRLAMIIKLLTF